MAIGKTASERIERANLAIMKHPSFCAWAGLLFIGNWSIEPDAAKCPTAYVNARGDVKYGKDFIERQPKQGNTDPHVNYVVLHETGHKALMHLTRGIEYFKKNPMIANIAADHVVNNLIEESDPNGQFAKKPVDEQGNPFGACDTKYRGWSLKQVYEDLMKNAKTITIKVKGKGKGQGGGQGEPGDGSGEGGMDTHDISGEGGGELTKEEQQAIEQAIDQALRNGSYLASKQGGNANRLVGSILEPKIDWKSHMAEFVQEACAGDDDATWRRPMRRFVGDDLYLPSMYSETIGKVVFTIDVSGSVGDEACNACISEGIALCRQVRPSKLVLVYWDVGIKKVEEYTPDQYDDIIRLTKPVGGGGTDVEPVAAEVVKWEDVQCVVNLTDGYLGGGWGDWKSLPVLWVLTTKGILADCGKSLYLDLD